MLLHICCAPCSIYPLKKILEEDIEVSGYYYNPNIHPFTEWRQRRNTLEEYMKSKKLELFLENEYGLIPFLREVVHRENNRCPHCYAMRLKKTALMALEKGFDCFSTTLLVSPYQKHQLIKEIAESIGQEVGIPFYYQDFRVGYQYGVEESINLEMYRQKYCGCIYSEQERYDKSFRKKQKNQVLE